MQARPRAQFEATRKSKQNPNRIPADKQQEAYDMSNRTRMAAYLFLGTFLLLIGSVQFASSQMEQPGSPENYGVGVIKDVMVPMRDGAKLATDIYYPVKDGAPVPGKFPV